MLKACVCLIVLYDFGTCAASILIFGFPVSCGLGSFENALFIDGNYPVRGNGLEREKKKTFIQILITYLKCLKFASLLFHLSFKLLTHI